ncbi:hypothetical protein [Candidatus Hodarchaeum mangrovi]
MSKSEIAEYIEEINKQMFKTINIAYEKSRRIRESVQKEAEKVREGSKKLLDETDPQLTEEGVQKITKKGKIYFRSLKAMNSLVHFLYNQFDEFDIPNPKNNLSFNDFNQFIRSLSRLMNDTTREQKNTDSIMGLDFMLKKRGIYGPISKLNSDLKDLRELQKAEYTVIKALEDLDGLYKDVEELKIKKETTEVELEAIKLDRESLSNEIQTLENDISKLFEDPVLRNSRERGIRMTELEIEIGRHLNSFKKIFKKYAREVQRGSISGDFGLVNAAIAYEEEPVKRYLEESETNPEIISLFQELIKVGEESLKLKQKHLTNMKQELLNIEKGKMNVLKEEWKQLANLKDQDETSSEFRRVNEKLIQLETKMGELKSKLEEKDNEISLTEKSLVNLAESLEERKDRAKSIRSEVISKQG